MTTNSTGAHKENFNLNIWYYGFIKNGTADILEIDFDDGEIRKYLIANQSGSDFFISILIFLLSK